MHAGGRRYTAVIVLVAINVLVWVAWQIARSDMAMSSFMHANFMASARGVLGELRLHTLLTSCFSQIDIGHIFFNMLFFWFIGDDVERIYGFRNFFWLYAFTGVCATVAYVGVHALMGDSPSVLGASGAVMGIAVVAAIFDPQKPVSIWGLVTVSLRTLVIVFILIDLLAPFGGGDSVARAAHLGGAAAGFLFWKLDLRLFDSPGRTGVGALSRLRRWLRRKPKLRIVERIPEELPSADERQSRRDDLEGVGEAERVAAKRVDPATSRRVDELLAKISRQGLDALTAEERTFLAESSRKYQRGS
jgi:membrane associated rhomboid family serine protease